jgi:hypothetical protein
MAVMKELRDRGHSHMSKSCENQGLTANAVMGALMTAMAIII